MTPYEVVRESYAFPFDLRNYQIDEVNYLAPEDRAGYYWEPGCVDSETEYLSPTGWVKISEYSGGEVAQYHPDSRAIEFVQPDDYLVMPCPEMVRVRGPNVDQMLSPEHRVLLYGAEGWITVPVKNLAYEVGPGYLSFPVGNDASGRVSVRDCTFARAWPTDGSMYCFRVPSTFLLFRRNGCVFASGNTGKTAGSTHHALYWKLTAGIDQWVLILPPILLPQWEAWLKQVKRIDDGAHPSITVYAGSPKKRAELSLDSEFILVSMGVFKNDIDRFLKHFEKRRPGTLVDEATSVKNTETANHKAVKEFSEGRPLQILTGTPLAKPGDAFAYVRLLTGKEIYRNKRHFEQLHVGDVDDYGNVKTWTNLELLAQNMKVRSSRIIRREVRKELPAIIYQPVPYELDPAHHKLYTRLADEKLVELDNGTEINAITAQKLRSSLQQIVCNWGHFESNPERRPAVLDVIENTFEEIGSQKKLVIVANFQMTNRYMLEALKEFGAVAVYGEVTPTAKQAAIRRFVEDPACRTILLQPQSAGLGVDGLQHVCSDMLVIEAPQLALHFHQVVARLDRDGQESPVLCRVAVAQRTIQVRLFKELLANDSMVNSIQGGYQDLRDAIYGG